MDAAFRHELLSRATGAVLRDNKGFFIGASSHLLSHVPDVVTAEAYGLLHGLQLADLLGCHKVLVNSDVLFQATKEGGHFHGPAAAVLEECFKLVSELHDMLIKSRVFGSMIPLATFYHS